MPNTTDSGSSGAGEEISQVPPARADDRGVIDVERATVARLVPSIRQVPDAVVTLDQEGRVRDLNPAAGLLVGYELTDVVGRSIFDFLHPDDVALTLMSFETVVDKEFGSVITVRFRDGDDNWVEVDARGAVGEIDGTPAIVLVLRPTADRLDLALDGGDAALLRSVVENMRTMVALLDADGRVRSINAAATRVLGLDPELVRGKFHATLIHPDDHPPVFEAVLGLSFRESASLEARYLTGTGDHLLCEFTVTHLVDDPVINGYLVSGQPATALTAARDRVDFLAHHDKLTGLLNREGLFDSVRDLTGRGGGLGVMIVDVVGFRAINELHGDSVGDAVLSTIAERIDAVRWPGMTTARLGGDEFVVAVRSPNSSTITDIREQIVAAVTSSPVVVDRTEIEVAIRTATTFEQRPTGIDPLLAVTSTEMSHIKRNGAAESARFTGQRSVSDRRRQVLELRHALDEGQIVPHFQPIVHADGVVRAVEALVRWEHPERGVLGVGHILPLAQIAGLAGSVDRAVLDESFRYARRLDDESAHVEVHVNVDPRVLGTEGFATTFVERCEELGARPHRMVVELTENDLLDPGSAVLTNLRVLRDAGVRISIDDFGTGYSSLSHLLELPVDGLKIDRRFVAGLGVDAAAANLTRAIVGLGDSLRLSCVAEGVETVEQLDRLTDLGCDAFQGWLFAAALPGDAMLDSLPRVGAGQRVGVGAGT